MRQTFVSSAYPPSTTALADLETIDISMLRLETHHRGKVLVVSTFVEATRPQSFQSAVEDVRGAVDRIALYNENPDLHPSQVLPKGAFFAIKEPYYKTTADGGYIIRVDHPSDLIKLKPGENGYPVALGISMIVLQSTSLKCKEDGNQMYLKKDYLSALDSYTRGITLCGSDELALRCDLLRNRAAVNLSLARYESALEDATSAVIPGGLPNAAKYNTKAHLRQGRAAYALRDWKSADTHYAEALLCTPTDQDSLTGRKCVADRQREATSGNYDFTNISDSLGEESSRLDIADFLSNTEVRPAGRHGRGLFTAKALKAGDLILCEKAFAIRFRYESKDEVVTVININTNRGCMGPHAMLSSDIIQNLRHNPKQAARFVDLYDGGYEPKSPLQQIDGVVVLDTFQGQAVVDYNCFGSPDVRSVGDVVPEKDPLRSTGIWIQASYMNHSCDPNAARAFIGDLMIVHANRDIAKDEEIYISYILPDVDYQKTKRKLMSGWGFQCDCKICAADSRCSSDSRNLRRKLTQEVQALMAANQQSASFHGNKATIREAERLYQKINATYDADIFTGDVPRLGLYALGEWLCHAHTSPTTVPKSIACGMSLLKDLAFAITVKGNSVTFDRSTGLVSSMSVTAAAYVANGHFFLGRKRLAKQFIAFAKEMYITLYGELRGFVERFGDVVP